MSSGPADACTGHGEDFSRLEYYLFEEADEAVLKILNAVPANGSSNVAVSGQKDRAVEALTKLERSSAGINKDWPDENRFHFEVLDIPPALAVKMTYRNRTTFTVFDIPQFIPDQKSITAWQAVYAADDGRFEPSSPLSSMAPAGRYSATS
jgi:hypothetical protein